MSELKDKQAYPRSYAYQNPQAGQSELKSEQGMTLREHYAGLAMQGFCADDSAWEHNPNKKAEQAVKMADALIAELEKNK